MANESSRLRLATVLLAGAIAFQVGALTCASKSIQSLVRTRQAKVDSQPAERISQLKVEASRWFVGHNVLMLIGLVGAGWGTGLWVIAIMRRQPDWKLLPGFLVVLYIIVFLVMV